MFVRPDSGLMKCWVGSRRVVGPTPMCNGPEALVRRNESSPDPAVVATTPEIAGTSDPASTIAFACPRCASSVTTGRCSA